MLNTHATPKAVRRAAAQDASAIPASLRDTLMVAVQVLLDSAVDTSRDRFRVLGFRSFDEEDGLELMVCKGLDLKRSTLVVPVISRGFSSSIQWILQGRSASAARAAGVTTAYWTSTQGCRLLWSKTMVSEFMASDSAMSDAEKARAVESAPDAPTLLLNGGEMTLPSPALCNKVFRALEGEAVVVSNEDLDALESFLASGLPLCSGPNPDQVGIRDAFVLMRSKMLF